MPIRGENVGTAYVKILADGTGLTDSIKDELDDTEGEFGKSGERAGEQHSEGVAKGLKKNQPRTQKAVRELFEIKGNNARQLVAQMEGTVFRGLEKSINARHSQTEGLGERIIRDIKKGFLRDGGFASFGDDFENLFARLPAIEQRALEEMARDQRAHERELQKGLDERESAVRLSARRQADYWRDVYNEAYSFNQRFDTDQQRAAESEMRRIDMLARAERAAYQERDRMRDEEMDREIAMLRTRETRFTDSLDRLQVAFKRVSAGQANTGESLAKSLDTTIDHVRELRVEMEHLNERGIDTSKWEIDLNRTERSLGRITPRLRTFNGVLDRSAPIIGRAFGKGARNDFVNLFGVMIEGSVRMVSLVPKVAEHVIGMGGAFKTALSSGAGLGGALKAMTSGGGGLAALAPVAAGAAAALGILVLVLPVVASAVAMLGGAIIALVGSITFGAIGAVGALAGAFLPLVAGIAVLTAGIMSMSDAQRKALSTAMRPMTEEFKAWGRAGAGAIFRDAAEQATRMGEALQKSDMERMVRRIGNAIRHIGDDWIAAIDSPGFRRFSKEMGTSLPGQLEKLGTIIKNTIGGIGGIFIGLQPITDRFLTWLDKITAKFSAWANSASGQEEIVSFFERAGDSAASLGELIDNIGEALGSLFTSGQASGDTMIDQMAAKVQQFVDYLNANPDAVSKFFKDSGKFAEKLGTAVEGIILVFAALDSASSRSSAIGFFEGLGKAMKVVAGVGTQLENAFNLVSGVFQILFLPITTLIALFQDGIPGAVATVINAFADFVDGMSFVGSVLDAIPGISGVADAIDGVADKMRGFADGLVNARTEAGKPIDVKVNTQGLDDASTKAKNSTTDLNNLRDAIYGVADVPPIKPTVDLSGIKGGTDAAKALEKGLQDVFSFPGATPKVDALQIAAARLATAKAKAEFEAFAGVASKGTKLEIDAAAAEVAKGMVDRLKESINLIPRNVNINVTTRRKTVGDPGGNQTIAGATGGIMSQWGFDRVKKMAKGGFANYSQRYIIGEAGREAIVPLDRPLGQVDPAVRMLSAFAQGKLGTMGQTSNSRTVDASGWTIVSQSSDPSRVADEMLNELTGAVF